MTVRPGGVGLVLLGLVVTLSGMAACGTPPRPEATAQPATSVVQPGAVPGVVQPTRPVLAPAVAASPSPPSARLPSPSPGASPSPSPSPVIHPTLPRLDTTPAPGGAPSGTPPGTPPGR